jgi:hypothetical protein
MTRGFRGKMLVAAGALVLASGFAAPRLASAAIEANSTECGRRTVVNIDDKICPTTKRRPAVVVHRACCANPKGKVKCKRFPRCPRRSPS